MEISPRKTSHDWEKNLTAKSYAEVKANRVKTSINTILILKAEYFFIENLQWNCGRQQYNTTLD